MNSAWWFVLGGFFIGLMAGVVLHWALSRLSAASDQPPATSRQPSLLAGSRKLEAGSCEADTNRDVRDVRQFDQLARELVHELRNPLNSIDLHLQLMEEELSTGVHDAPALHSRVTRVRGEVERLDRILTDFRRYAKLPPLKLELCDLSALIHEVLDFGEPEAQRLNVEVVRDIQPNLRVRLDSAQFKQALLNLILNANQAMPDGGTLTARAELLDGSVSVEIEDTGHGILPEAMDKVFELFFSTKEDGTGVGLSIVKKVVEGHGGKIRVKSRPGQGTTFSMVLPV